MSDAFDAYYEWLSIPPAEQPANYYRLLGVQLFEPKSNVISTAADRQMAHVRSFQQGARAAQSQKLLNELAVARLCLLDPNKKSAYDQKLKTHLAATAQVATASNSGPAASAVAKTTAGETDPGKSSVRAARPVAAAQSAIGRQAVAKPLATATPLDPAAARSAAQPTFDMAANEASIADGKMSARRAAARTRAARQRLTGAVVTGIVLIAAGGGAWWWQSQQPQVATSTKAQRETTGSGSSNSPDAFEDSASPPQGESNQAADGDRATDASPADSDPADSLDPDSAQSQNEASTGTNDASNHALRPKSALVSPPDAAPLAVQPPQIDAPAPPLPQRKAPSGKPSPPDAQALADARVLVNDLYKTELAAAKKAAQKCELAQKMLKLAGESQSDPAAQYALWNLARDLAVDGGDARVAVAAIEAIAGRYELDVLAAKSAALGKIDLAKSPAGTRNAVAELAQQLLEQAAAQDDYDTAVKLCKTAVTAAKYNKDPARGKLLKDRGRELTILEKKFAEVQTSLATLAEHPNDPAANLEAGRWFCFYKGDWTNGLPRLARCQQAQFAELAGSELAGINSPSDQEKHAEALVALADTEAEPAKTQIRRHARLWLERALPGLSGISKTKAEKELAALPDLLPNPSRPVVVGQMLQVAGVFGTGGGYGVITADGARILIFRDRVASIVDLDNGRDRIVFAGHNGAIVEARLSGDEKRVVTLGADDTLRVWDATTGSELRKFPVTAEYGGWAVMVVSPDGKRVVFTTAVGTVLHIWDLDAGRELGRFDAGNDCSFKSISRNGRVAIAGGIHNTVRVFDVLTGKKAGEFDGHIHTYCAALSPDGALALVGGGNDVRLWNTATHAELSYMTSVAGHVYALAFSPDGRRVVSGNGDGSVVLWDLAAKRDLQHFHGHTAPLRSVVFTPDGRRAVSASNDNTVRVWGLPD